jgi:hypothetical protein
VIKLKGKLPLANPGDTINRTFEDKFPKVDAKGDEQKGEESPEEK